MIYSISEIENALGNKISKIENLRSKDGVEVSRVFYGGKTCIVKCFENKNYIREIDMYKLVNSLGIKTLKIYYFGNNFIIMEDLNTSKDYNSSYRNNTVIHNNNMNGISEDNLNSNSSYYNRKL